MMRNATSGSSISSMIFLIIVAFIGGGISSSGSGRLFASGFVILPSSRSSNSAPFTNKITIQTQTRMRTALPITTTTATTSTTTTTTTTTDDDEEEDLTTSSSSSSSLSSSTNKIKSKNKDKSTSKKIRPIHKNWWPVACLSSLENDKPNSITLLNKKLVLFRSSTSSSSSSSSDDTDDGSEHNSHDDDDDVWTCLDDRCSHRFAPLSEGRLVPSTEESEVDSTSSTVEGSKASSSSCTSCKIQCAYHGWEFDGKGSNTKIPQQQTAQRQKQKQKQGSSRQDVQSYPIRIKAGMIFIWSDPDSYDTIGKHIEIPVSKSTQDAYNSKGNIFQRDLPYGYELLGENLLDLSHLPFSHHSVGGLDRSLGTPLPFRMLNETEKSALNDKEDSSSYPSTVTPLYEVEIMNASRSDPVLLSMKGTPDTATAHVGFYQPCHVRYNRVVPDIQSSQVILYFCPTSSTKSRVFLMNVFERKEKKQEVVDEDTSSPELLIETAEVSTSTSTSSSTPTPTPTTASKEPLLSSFYKRLKSIIQKKLFQIIIKIKFTPTYMHLMNHKIFDGDGIFLAMQGDRMQRGGTMLGGRSQYGHKKNKDKEKSPSLSYRDYQTPSSADVLVNAFRRYVTLSVKKDDDNDDINDTINDSIIDSVQPTKVKYDTDNIPRSKILDRYESHTKNCPLCRNALKKGRQREKILNVVHTALIGSTGASFIVSFISCFTASTTSSTADLVGISKMIAKIAFGVMIVTGGSVFGISKLQQIVKDYNQQFIFVDYIHADKH